MFCELGWAHEDPKFDHTIEFTSMKIVLTEKTPRAYKFLTFFETRNKHQNKHRELTSETRKHYMSAHETSVAVLLFSK